MNKKDLVFVTNNQHKLREVKKAIEGVFNILSLSDIGFKGDIEEPYETLEENAMAKVDFIYNKYQCNCFADDTGLMINALNGAPGVYSARYAGENCTPKDNILKVMKELQGVSDRDAHFATVIALHLNDERHYFKGIAEGQISENYDNSEGFGYDPIFIPKGYDIPFSRFELSDKNKISHRGKAVKKLIEFLKNQ